MPSNIENTNENSVSLFFSSTWNTTQEFCGHSWSIIDGGLQPLCKALELGGRVPQLFSELSISEPWTKKLSDVSKIFLDTRSFLLGSVVLYDLSPSPGTDPELPKEMLIVLNNKVHWYLSKITSTLDPISIALSVFRPDSVLLIIITKVNSFALFAYFGTMVTKSFCAGLSDQHQAGLAKQNLSEDKIKLQSTFSLLDEDGIESFLQTVRTTISQESNSRSRSSFAIQSVFGTRVKVDVFFKNIFGDSSTEIEAHGSVSNAELIYDLLSEFQEKKMSQKHITFLASLSTEHSQEVKEGKPAAIKLVFGDFLRKTLTGQAGSQRQGYDFAPSLIGENFFDLLDSQFEALKDPKALRESSIESCAIDDSPSPVLNQRKFTVLKNYLTSEELILKHSHQMNANFMACAAAVAQFAVCIFAVFTITPPILCTALRTSSAILSVIEFFYLQNKPITPLADREANITIVN
jgi:hypothetical protein